MICLQPFSRVTLPPARFRLNQMTAPYSAFADREWFSAPNPAVASFGTSLTGYYSRWGSRLLLASLVSTGCVLASRRFRFPRDPDMGMGFRSRRGQCPFDGRYAGCQPNGFILTPTLSQDFFYCLLRGSSPVFRLSVPSSRFALPSFGCFPSGPGVERSVLPPRTMKFRRGERFLEMNERFFSKYYPRKVLDGTRSLGQMASCF